MKFFGSIVVICLLVACGTSKQTKSVEGKKVITEIVWDEMEATPIAPEIDLTTPKVFHGAETIFTDLIHTKLEVSFDWNKSWLLGTATITAKAHFYAADSLILDAKGMEIKSVSLGTKNLTYRYDTAFLRIKLDKTYSKNENYTIKIDYIAKPDERQTSGSAAITSDKGLYFINPKGEDKAVMPQIWTQGETEANSVWFPTIDAPNVKTTQEILITVDNKYQTLSNGKLVKSTKNANGTRTDHWKQDLPHAPYLFMMGVGEFKVVKDSYTRKNGEKMDVNYYVEPEWEPYAKAIFGETPAMIKFFSELTGVEYPWDKYHQIVVRDYVSGAMENTGAVIFGDYAYKTHRELLDENDNSTIAHELFHHWFGDLVTCESWSNLPLNESFANYSQYLWDEYRHGLDEADYQAEIEKDGYYGSASNGGAHNLIWYDYDDKEQMFDGHSYNKGGRILHMLRNVLGDEAFFAGLKLYLQTNQFKAAEFHHLRQAFEEVSGQDLNWFFNQWFLASGHPILDVEQYFSEANKEVVLTVIQQQDLTQVPLYQLPVQVMVIDEAGEHLHTVTIKKKSTKFTFPVQGKLLNVIFDYQQCILGKITEKKPDEQFIHQYYNGKRYLARKNGLLNGSVKTTPAASQMVLDALKDPFWDIRLTAIEGAGTLTLDHLDQAIKSISQLASTDPNSQVRAEALQFLNGKLPLKELELIYQERLEKDSSYLVAGTALNELFQANPDLAMSKAKALENSNSSKMKSSIAQIYAAKGGEASFAYFEKLLNENQLKAYDAIICLNSFSYYVSRQKPEIQERALPIYESFYKVGGQYVKMFMPQNTNFIVGSMQEKMMESKVKLEVFEKNKEQTEVERIKTQQRKQEEVLGKYQLFLEGLNKQK